MAPTASGASSKPPVYPKSGEPAHRAPSKTRSGDPVRKSATDSGLRKRSQSEEVSAGSRSKSRSAKSVTSAHNSIIAKPTIESRDRYIRTVQRDSRSREVRSQNVRLNGKSSGKTTGPLKAFPTNGMTSGSAPSDSDTSESVSTESLLVDSNSNSSTAENPAPISGRRYSSSEKQNASGFPRPLPVFIRPEILPSSVDTFKSDRRYGHGDSKQSGQSHRDSKMTSSRSVLENAKTNKENGRTSTRAPINKNEDVTETFERIALDSALRNANKPRIGSKAELPDIELKGNSNINKHNLPETERRKASYSKFTGIADKSVRLGVNGGGEVLGGRSAESSLQTEGYDYSKYQADTDVKSRSTRSSVGAIKDLADHSVSSKSSKSDIRTETFVFNVDQSLENRNDAVERNQKMNIDSTTKPSSSSSSVNGKSGKAGVVGLRNLGNTCFMNCVLQCLSNTRLLRDFCLDKRYEKDVNRSSSSMRGKMINVYADLMEEMWRGSQSYVSPTEFKSEISNFAKQFVGYREQDAHEFLVYLLEALHEDVNRVREKRRRIIDSTDEVETISSTEKAKISWKNYLACDNSQINDIFVGQLKSTLRCLDCAYVSNTFEPFLALSLPLKKVKTRMTLLDCFKLFSQEEILDFENQPRCAKCRMQKSCTKQMSIHRFPKVLIIHLMRFKQGSSTKLTTEVSCPLTDLDLSEFASTESTRESIVYSLYAVSNHSGSLYSGHYTAYARNPDSHQWHLFNDRTATSVSLPKLESGQPYLLFYQRQEQST